MAFGFSDNRKAGSVATTLRQRRLACFVNALQVNETTRIVDLGGSVSFWRNAGVAATITILNIEPCRAGRVDGFQCLQGDARDLRRYADGEFDVVFSNSVIADVGSHEDQPAMSREVWRVGRRYFVQTPNRTFPIEPHFLFPCFQMLPAGVRESVARVWPFGWRQAGSPEAMRDATAIRLLDVNDVSRLFPDAVVLGEQCIGLTKSLIAVRPPAAAPGSAGFRTLRRPPRRLGRIA